MLHQVFVEGLDVPRRDLRLVARGFTNAKIADRLFISQMTVKSTCTTFLTKPAWPIARKPRLTRPAAGWTANESAPK